MNAKDRAFVKSCLGGFGIGAATRLVFGLTPVTFVVSTVASLAWGSYCAWEGLSSDEKASLRKWYNEKVEEGKQPHPQYN